MKNHILMNLQRKSVFVFDWDGTLFDSMEGKTHSFSLVVSNYLKKKNKHIEPYSVATLYRFHSGKPRSEIFREIAKVAGLQLDQTDIDEMSKLLFEYNRTVLAKAVLFSDALRFLDSLVSRDVKLFISSSVPQTELDYFVSAVLPDSLLSQFSGVLGSSNGCSKGSDHIDIIRTQTCALRENIIVIGDDEADYVLSKAAGVTCVLVDRDGKFDDSFLNIVKNLDELCTLLNLPVSTL
jgi:phosphoglycolate phosphatase-like HAD superfamily hydrolase